MFTINKLDIHLVFKMCLRMQKKLKKGENRNRCLLFTTESISSRSLVPETIMRDTGGSSPGHSLPKRKE